MLSCPFCNAQAAVTGPAVAGQRVTCSRCGEAFIAWETDLAIPSLQTAPPAASKSTPRRWPNGIIAALILGGMCVVGLITLQFALSTVSERRQVDKQKPIVETLSVPLLARVALGVYVLVLAATVLRSWNRNQTEQPPLRRSRVIPIAAVASIIGIGLILLSIQSRPARDARPSNQAALAPVPAVPPAELAALSYLPPDTNVIAGVHVAEALQNPLSRDFLLRYSPTTSDAGFDALERLTGLRLPDIDHAVLGIKLDDQFPPRAMLVVRTFREIDENEVRRTLRAVPIRERGRTVFRFNPERPRLEAFAWRADDKTLIVALHSKDFDQVSTSDRPVGEQIPAPMQSYLRDRVKSAPIWVVGHVADWAKTPVPLLAAELKTDLRTFSGINTFGSWLQFGDGLQFSAAFECKDVTSAQMLLDSFTVKEGADRREPTNWLPSFDHDPFVRALSRSATTTRDGAWVTVQARTEDDTWQKQAPR